MKNNIRIYFCFVVCNVLVLSANAQLPVDSISSQQATSILNYLSADSLKGRGAYTPELHQSANFIANYFKRSGLKYFPGSQSFFQPFTTKDSVEIVKDSSGYYNPKNVLLNIVGVLEGRSKPGEAIIFSAHYDHVGIHEGAIYNGANDNASGTTALMLLAGYFAKRNDNERTLIFCAFAGEEIGLYGSSAFVPHINTDSIIAVINIEMIGISSVGRNAIFITGAGYSDFSNIIEKALKGKLRVRREPDISKQLFKRSDNFPFALKGIPAHSIMASDDDDACYHQPCDDVKRIDVGNMTNIIRAIATGSESLINRKETPKRINVKKLR